MRQAVELFIHTTNELAREQAEYGQRVEELHADYSQALKALAATEVDDYRYQRRAAEVAALRDRWLDAVADRKQMLELSSKRQEKVRVLALAKLDEVLKS